VLLFFYTFLCELFLPLGLNEKYVLESVLINVLIAYDDTMSTDARGEGIRHFVKKIWENLRQGKWPADRKAGTALPSSKSRGHIKMRFPKLKKEAS
jgi:hypothetical protein